MSTAAVASRHFRQPLISSSSTLISKINSILQSLNPQNPQTHNSPDPSILNKFSPYLTQNLVIQIIKTQTSPYHSLFFFNWASTQNPNHYTHSHFCYIAITDKLLSHNLFSLASDLLKTHNKFSDFMVGKFIKAHGDLGHLNWAVKLFRQVKERELGDCLFSFNALLGVLVKANLVKHAWGYFGNVIIKGRVLEPDVSTYTTMIRGFCKIGMIEEAEKLFGEMSCGKNLITYNVMIDGFCKNGLVEKAQRVVDEMVGDESFLPDVVSYTSLMDGYCKKGEVEKVMGCFNEMVSRGNCEPNVLTYNVLINGLCLNGDVDGAKRMMSKMRLSGVKVNVTTHTSLLKGYCVAGRSDDAFKHFKEMVIHGMSLDGKMYAVIINEYGKLGRPDEGLVLLREMRTRGVKPILASFNAVIRSFVKLKEFDKAIAVLKEMSQMGCYPNFLSYSEVIIGLLEVNGWMKEAEMLVIDMIQNGHKFDTNLYSTLINAYCINRDICRAVGLFNEMIGEKIVIRKECFGVFVKELCSSGLTSEAENLFDQMRKYCPVSDVETYQSVLDECLCGKGEISN